MLDKVLRAAALLDTGLAQAGEVWRRESRRLRGAARLWDAYRRAFSASRGWRLPPG